MYAKRKGMIEPIFGQLKQVLGFRQFSLRGLASMRGEWRLMATVHNLLKLWRHDQRGGDGGVIPAAIGRESVGQRPRMRPSQAIQEGLGRRRRSLGEFGRQKKRRRPSRSVTRTNS